MRNKIVFFIILMVVPHVAQAEVTGDSILHLGATGYADLTDANMSDIDYTKDFSVEAYVNIDANEEVGRWAYIIGKTSRPYDATSGFALVFTGFFDSFGQQIYAKVGDGVTGITTQSTKFYEGQTHCILTWNVSSKNLSLYVNGELVGTKTNSSLVSTNIKNNHNFDIGSASILSYGTLGKDIILARLWNRILSQSEISAIYISLASTGRHNLPPSVSAADLKSEWLMEETSDHAGNPGTTNIKDTAGSNHLLLHSAAAIQKGNGNLVLEYPANMATEVSPAVFLKASGGADTLGITVTNPLWYYFQIDESSSFNSPALKESGWQAGYATWKPVLKPGTIYYWHVRVKDSADSPAVSSYSEPYSFTTRDAKNWYIRPGIYDGNLIRSYIPKTVANTYGTEDGQSYQNAWNGIRNIVWGENGVAAGDDVYVCGSHVYTVNNGNFFPSQANEFIKESGYSDDYPITIRMDCPGDKGILWGVWKDNRTLVIWNGPDVNGVYSTSNLPYGAAAQMIANGSLVWLDAESATTWTGHPGATNFSNGVTYVKTIDGSSPQGKIYSPYYGFRFYLSRSSYIKFYQCNLYNMNIAGERIGTTVTDTPPPQHIRIDSTNLAYYGTLVQLYKGHDHWTITDSDLSNAGNGIYAYGNDGAGANYLTVRNTKIHDIGTVNFAGGDCHCIGIQGGEGHVFEHNEMWNGGGSAIEFWTYSQPMKNMTVRYNYIHDIYVRCITGANGIAVSGDNVGSVEGLRTGYKIYNNIIRDVGLEAPIGWWGGLGIGSNNKDPMEVYNNIIINPLKEGLGIGVVGSGVAQGKYYNNIVVNPRLGTFIRFYSPSQPTNLLVDHNLFYPANPNDTRTTTSAFYIYPYVAHDANSVFSDPQFIGATLRTTADFMLKSSSPAIDAGVDVGLNRDFLGTTVPQGLAPDIGAFEYTPSCYKSEIPPCDGCVSDIELTAFITRWYMSSTDVTLKELMEAIGYWKRGAVN